MTAQRAPAAPTRPAPRPAPFARAVAAQAGMELRLLLRSGESLLVTFGIPLGILGFFSLVDVLPTGGGDPVDFLVPGVLAISVMSSAFVALAIQTAFERKYAVLKRLGGTPLTRLRYLAAKVAAVGVLVVLQTLLVLAVARWGLGWPAGTSPTQAVAHSDTSVTAVVVGMVLGTATFVALGLLLAGSLRAEATLALSNALYLVLLLISGLTIDLSELPEPLAAAVVWLPSGALGVVLRDGLGSAWPHTWPTFALVLAGWGAGAAVLASRTFRWEPT